MQATDPASPNSSPRLKIAFLIGNDSPDRCAAIVQLSQLKGIETVAVLVDTASPTSRVRRRNLVRNIRREGLSYMFFRGLSMLRNILEDSCTRVIPAGEVEELLLAAFPDHGLDRLAARFRFPVFRTGNLNGAEAIQHLRNTGADLGVVLGTRILKRPLFSVPRLGCINLHKGKVPEYRGTPPGFWELYEGANSAGVTVHFVDDGLDTGDVMGTSEVPVHPKETPESLKAKLDAEGIRLLCSVVERIQRGDTAGLKQPRGEWKPRTRPTRSQVNDLARRLPHWRRLPDGRQIFKMAIWLAVFHSGLFQLIRWTRRNKSRGAILLYHRVNDVSEDVLTASTKRFAEHLVTLRHYYRIVSTAELIERIGSRTRIEPTSVAIHFDDCYRDVRICAAPLLEAAGAAAMAFISSGFVDTDRAFRHDCDKYPHRFENLKTRELTELPAMGVEIAAHTVNHVDLGKVSLEEAQLEVVESRQQLEQILGRPVLLFSFPFGGYHNIRQEVREMVVAAGYRALFSAHGGFVGPNTELFDVPRFGTSSDHSPLALLMELEGISTAHLTEWLRSRLGGRS